MSKQNYNNNNSINNNNNEGSMGKCTDAYCHSCHSSAVNHSCQGQAATAGHQGTAGPHTVRFKCLSLAHKCGKSRCSCCCLMAIPYAGQLIFYHICSCCLGLLYRLFCLTVQSIFCSFLYTKSKSKLFLCCFISIYIFFLTCPWCCCCWWCIYGWFGGLWLWCRWWCCWCCCWWWSSWFAIDPGIPRWPVVEVTWGEEEEKEGEPNETEELEP